MLPDGATSQDTLDTTKIVERGVKYASEVGEIEFTLRQAMRTPTYWLLMLVSAGYGLVIPVMNIHAVPLITDMGVNPLKAAVVIGAMSASNMPGMLIAGLVSDRVKKQHLRFILTGAFALQLASFLAFMLNPVLTMVYPLFIIHHFTGGIHSILNSVITPRYFGRKAFGSIRGTSMIFTLPVSILAPIYAGWVYDTTGSYVTVFTISAVLIALSAISISLAFPPKPPAQVTSIHQIT
jgi:sugar phosphate permease